MIALLYSRIKITIIPRTKRMFIVLLLLYTTFKITVRVQITSRVNGRDNLLSAQEHNGGCYAVIIGSPTLVQ